MTGVENALTTTRSIGILCTGYLMNGFLIIVLVFVNMSFSTLSNMGFKLSAGKDTFWGFWSWQIVGNLAGFVAVLAFTRLLRYLPLHIAFPLTQGLAVVAVQLLAAQILFREEIRPLQWLGTTLVAAGIVLIGARQPG